MDSKIRNFLKGVPFLIPLFLISLIEMTFGYTNNYIILLIYVVYLGTLFYSDKRFLLRYGYIIFYISTNILGVFLIETNTFFLTELNMMSFPNDSLLLITVAHVIFIETIRFFHCIKDDEETAIPEMSVVFSGFTITKTKLLKYFLVVLFIVFAVLFIRVINKPYFVVKLDRFLYEQQYLTSFLATISNSVIYISSLIGIYFFFTKDKKVFFPVLLIVFIYLFWIGHKFSVFLNISYILFLPFIWYGSKKLLSRIFKYGMGLLLFLIVIVSFQSYFVYDRNFNENLTYITERLAQQGQLWWATYGLEKDQGNHTDEISDEVSTYFRVNLPDEELYNSGIYKIMKLTTPIEVFDTKVNDKNSRYAYSTESTIYYYFKGAGLIIFSIITGWLYFLINNRLIKNMVSMNLIATILYTRLFVLFNRALLQSDFNKLFSYEVVFIILAIISLSLLEKIKSKNKLKNVLPLEEMR